MDQAEPAAGERYLLLADISGYTGFMTGVEHEHGVDFSDGIPAAYGVLAELLNSVIEGVEHDFGIVKLEGDAVFAAAPAAEPRRPGRPACSRISGRCTGRSSPAARRPSRPTTTSASPVPRSRTSTSRWSSIAVTRFASGRLQQRPARARRHPGAPAAQEHGPRPDRLPAVRLPDGRRRDRARRARGRPGPSRGVRGRRTRRRSHRRAGGTGRERARGLNRHACRIGRPSLTGTPYG